MPSFHRVLYRPWFFAGTPLWDRLDGNRADLRSKLRPKRGAGGAGSKARLREWTKPESGNFAAERSCT